MHEPLIIIIPVKNLHYEIFLISLILNLYLGTTRNVAGLWNQEIIKKEEIK